MKDRFDRLEYRIERLEGLLNYACERNKLPLDLDKLTAEDRQDLINFGHIVQEVLAAAPNREETAAEIIKILHSV
jgi:hypothetical protein